MPAASNCSRSSTEEAAALVRVQDAQSGLWYEVLDKGGAKGNYLESSASCMFVYALAKGVRRGYLPEHYLANAERGYNGILTQVYRGGSGRRCVGDRYGEGGRTGRRPVSRRQLCLLPERESGRERSEGRGAVPHGCNRDGERAECKAGPRRHGGGGRLVQLAEASGCLRQGSVLPLQVGYAGRSGLFAVRPHLPELRRGDQGTGCGADACESSQGAGLRDCFAGQPGQESACRIMRRQKMPRRLRSG